MIAFAVAAALAGFEDRAGFASSAPKTLVQTGSAATPVANSI